MRTANLVKVSGAKMPKSLVHYNMRQQKTTGDWNQYHGLKQSDLLSFEGSAYHPGMPLRREGDSLAHDMYFNASSSGYYKSSRYNVDGTPRINLARTVIQSFDYKANPDLKPKAVHEMGIELFHKVQGYEQYQYGYSIDGGMVSTHIDDDRVQIRKMHNGHTKIVYPHLHNHIVFPSYNSGGTNICRYLRTSDIYAFQRLNDQVIASHNLKDYYFGKLYHTTHPSTAYSMSQLKARKHPSNLQKSFLRFADANDRAWDAHGGDIKQARAFRNRYLLSHYHLRSDVKHRDSMNHKLVPRFTMADFYDKNGQQQWYNFKNLRLLIWKDPQDIRRERLVRQFDFKGVKGLSMHYSTYRKTIKHATEKVPDVSKIQSGNQRSEFTVRLSEVYADVKRKLKRRARIMAKKAQHVKHTAIQKLDRAKRRAEQYAEHLQSELEEHRHERDDIRSPIIDAVPTEPIKAEHQDTVRQADSSERAQARAEQMREQDRQERREENAKPHGQHHGSTGPTL